MRQVGSFSPGTYVSSTNKTDITELLWKMAWNSIKPSQPSFIYGFWLVASNVSYLRTTIMMSQNTAVHKYNTLFYNRYLFTVRFEFTNILNVKHTWNNFILIVYLYNRYYKNHGDRSQNDKFWSMWAIWRSYYIYYLDNLYFIINYPMSLNPLVLKYNITVPEEIN